MSETLNLHPREEITYRARTALSAAIIDWAREHDLTYAEVVMILTSKAMDYAKYPIRMERHGSYTKRGGEA